MKRDPICGMTGTIERHGHWFCSEGCIAEYERRLRSSEPRGHPSMLRRLRDPWIWVPLSGLVLATMGSWSPHLAAAGVSAIYTDYVRKVGVPVLLGLLLGGVIDHFIPKAYVVRLLSGSRKRVIARATLLGFLASTCSHGCLALTIELHRKGASVPAAVSFLLASPWASMSLTFLLLSLFGARGLLLVGGPLLIAWLTGLIFQRLAARGLIEPNANTVAVEEGFSIRRDLAQRWRRYPWTRPQLIMDARGVAGGVLPLGRMVLGWVQLGLLLSALAGGLIPHGAFQRFFGPSLGGLLLTLLAATVVEVCSEGTAPLAFELYRHTGALGNAFAFLMGGVITDYTELAAVWRAIGKRTVLWILLVTIPMVVALGLILNLLR
ncbi:MAG: permease [Candidatus Omnitrophica bacterium]|nr:permease [Candidatus Omnitrophota bacterium]